MCEPVSCLALGGAACYGCREFARPLTDRITAARVRARKRKEGIQLRAAASSTSPTQSELAVAALWRFAHLMLARARGFHDQAARAAALRLVICDDIPLDAVRVIAVAFHEQVDARKLKLREPTIKERYLAKLPLPGLRHSEGDSGAGGAEKDKRRLAKDAFYALGSLAMTSRCVFRGSSETTAQVHQLTLPTSLHSDLAQDAAAVASEVLDSPAASAQPGEREAVAESIKRLADALQDAHATTLAKLEKEASAAAAAAERARSRANSGRTTEQAVASRKGEHHVHSGVQATEIESDSEHGEMPVPVPVPDVNAATGAAAVVPPESQKPVSVM